METAHGSRPGISPYKTIDILTDRHGFSTLAANQLLIDAVEALDAGEDGIPVPRSTRRLIAVRHVTPVTEYIGFRFRRA